jgi:hypothetical protein
MHLRIKKDTYLKKQLKMADQLSDADKVLVAADKTFDIQYYVDVGNHWQIELAKPEFGGNEPTTWYVYEPDVELKTTVTLTVVSDTLFKLEPKLSSTLSSQQKVFVANGTQYELLAYLPAAGNHLKITLAGANLGPEQRNTWFVYKPDVKVAGDRLELRIVGDTLFKTQPKLSSELDAGDKVFVKKGTVFQLSSYGEIERNHIKVALEGAFLGPKNLTTWYVYVPDLEINGNTPGNRPNDTGAGSQPANPKDPGKSMKFPGFDGAYYMNYPIIWKTSHGARGHFTWGEATHGGTRIPESQSVVYGIVRVAKALEDIRHLYGGRSISINSWYRPPAINRAVGGARYSRHLQGDAVDFNVAGVHPHDVYKRLDGWWGNRGGLASSSAFTHIDIRGYRARWSYGY